MRGFEMRFGWLAFLAFFGTIFGSGANAQDENTDGSMKCEPIHEIVNRDEGGNRFGRTLCADIVALDQMLVYNRFGSFNPYGMMYALRRDVVSADVAPEALDADACDASLGVESFGTDLEPGKVRLRDCKRPRPLTLRGNPGDILHIRLTNMLRDSVPGFSDDYCTANAEDPAKPYGGLYHEIRGWLSEGSDSQVNHGEVSCKSDAGSPTDAGDTNWPKSRGANLAIQGLTAFGLRDEQLVEAEDACKGLATIAPGTGIDCYYLIEREGPFFMASTGAPSGGQGDGGSLTHGLFGAVIAEPKGSVWYRSQVSHGAFAEVWRPKPGAVPHAITDADIGDLGRYELTVTDPVSGTSDLPVLNMLRREEGEDTYSIFHSDLNAIVFRPAGEGTEALNFREFSVFFHDELKTFYPRNFEELGDFAGGQLAGVRDGFAINYGASGMGDMLLANRKGIGPSANCQECLYEEFFLTSWANGDPALLEQFSEDPSNVHHSYLNDEIVFRNFHAGPKETHVFHLHAHQWFAGNDGGRGSYLDSQTVGPQQGFSYDIYKGGMEVYHKGAPGEQGWYETLGSGNRNRTAGDSIFHCHLYPHFAQGMWELWRVHDVLEDGSRKLPDGQWEPSLSFAELNAATRAKKRPGSVDQETGRLIRPDGALTGKTVGTPIPALVPLPGVAWPVLPTYPEESAVLFEDGTVKADDVEEVATFPGYPFYIAGQPGHRPPQAPMDIARALEGEKVTEEYLDGGLPRHVVTDNSTRALPFNVPQVVSDRLALDPAPSTMAEALVDPGLRDREALQSQVIAAALALGDLSMKLKKVQIDLLEYDGEPIERAAMAFHHDGELQSGTPLTVRNPSGDVSGFVTEAGGYKTLGGIELFTVNGAPAKPGAPFADPCGAPAGLGQIARVDSTDYRFVVGGVNHPVLTIPAGQPLSGGVAASDAEVSNWVDHVRTDVYPSGPPQLYYVDGGGTAQLIERGAHVFEEDPFLKGLPQETFAADPAVVGYRRYEGSAVQVDLVTNRAGWHDPQARINVLSQNSDGYKDGGGRISPKVTASEEPFFFRALSGECIEFRHTNELPKELELDDFQVKTPTDTIGQHIHLVKFDVTSSDGSGNGFNYEDGTFAPGEIAARICAAKNDPVTAGFITTNRDPGALLIREFDGLCEFDNATELWKVSEEFDHKIWRLKLSEFRDLFQTTTQRWFADPILSETRAVDDTNGSTGAGLADRTLRTVFSHDHFGPSSIQQHGFYTALLIEPQTSQTCELNGTTCTPVRADREMIVADDLDVGARKVIVDILPVDNHDPDTGLPVPSSAREFALSIADFAVLYDPRNSDHPDEVAKTIESTGDMAMKGMLTLACEAKYGVLGDSSAMESQCGSALHDDGGTWSAGAGDVPPAWLAAARPGDLPAHSQGMEPSLFAGLTVDYHGATLPADVFLATYLTEYRMRAAGFDPADPDARLANPVAPPARPESISVDHHDPYLVNYRGEPFPLRLGVNSSGSSDCDLKDVDDWVVPLSTGVTEQCEISRQRASHDGDPANVLLNQIHGEPATPTFVTFDGDPVQFRLIQGAQEVQHTFTLEGYNWTRHIDQAFASAARDLDTVQPDTTLVRDCALSPGTESSVRMARAGRPDQYRLWALYGSGFFTDPDDKSFWRDMDRQMANCFNTEGRLAAQEVGISEHFEFKAGLLHDSNIVSLKDKVTLRRLNLNQLTRQELFDYLIEQREILVLKISVSDTPYHFGSQDALWNGAWGLVRVEPTNRNFFAYQRLIAVFDEAIADLNEDAALEDVLRDVRPYLNAPLDTVINRFPELTTNERLLLSPRALDPGDVDGTVTDRLVPLERFEQEALRSTSRLPEADRDKVLRRIEVPQVLRGENLRPTLQEYGRFFRDKTSVPEYKQVADCPARAPNVYTAIVAIETDTVFGSGTRYSDEIHDQNGLFFALVDPRALIRNEGEDLDAVSDVDIEDRARWTNVPLPRVVAEIQRVYSKPEPLVVNVKAGDCVHVTLLNALKTKRGANPGLVDDTGDAMMPGITSLNVERPWETVSHEENQPHVHSGATDRTKDVVPSSRLAVTFPLPVLTNQSVYARPYGKNQVWALNGIGDSDAAILSIRDLTDRLNKPRVAEIEQFRFYAGLVFADYRWIRSAPLVANAEPGLSPDFLANLGVSGGFEIPRELSAIPLADAAQPRTVGDTIGRFLEVQSDIRVRANDVLRPVIDLPEPRLEFEPQLPDFGGRAVLEPIERDALLGAPNRATVADGSALPGIGGLAVTLPDGARGNIASVTGVITAGERAGVITRSEASEINRQINDLTLELDVARERLIDDLVDVSVLKRELVPNFIPYAFGALPLKSFGDVIGHPTHGLVGAFTVVPQNAAIGDTRGPRVPFPACRNPQILPSGLTFDSAVPRLRLYDLGPIQADQWTEIGDLIVKRCNSFVIVPNKSERPFWNATLNASGPDNSCDSPGGAGQPCQEHRIRQFTLFWQDGLPLRDENTADTYNLSGSNEKLVKDCAICDDSYDWGDKGVSYNSEPFHVRLRSTNPAPIESHYNLNAYEFGKNFFLLEPGELPAIVNAPMPVLRAEAGEEIVVHVVHPGGRARQRAFATIAQDYDDLFPNFGFARAALLAPGKAITASIMKPAAPGCYLWFDGPLHLRAGGVWGLFDVVEPGDMDDRSATQCTPDR